jgi:3-hydroxyisobutyrate dehydrogenase
MQVGFIGLGQMGEGQAYNLAIKGFRPLILDVRPEPVQHVAAAGGRPVTRADEMGETDVVCISVFSEAQVASVLRGEGDDRGLLAVMKPGSAIVLHPTLSPGSVKVFAQEARAKQIDLIDAPMTGGSKIAADEGRLMFMVGGDAAVVDRVRPVLDAMAKNIFHLGELGAGCAGKIINNFIGISNTLVVREALRLSAAAGIGEEEVLHMLNVGNVGSNFATHNWAVMRVNDLNHTSGAIGQANMAVKDMLFARELARGFAVETPALDALVEYALPDIKVHGLTDSGLG